MAQQDKPQQQQQVIDLIKLGAEVSEDKAKPLKRGINQMLGWDSDEAPLSFPMPITRSNLDHIADHPYYVCEKSDGIRYLALLMQNGCYLVSPNYQLRYVPLYCPLRQDRIQTSPHGSKPQSTVHQWTLLDGLMVVDEDNEKQVLTFLAFDALAINGQSILAYKLPDRLKIIQNDIIAPRRSVAIKPQEMFQLALQSMYPVVRVSHVIRHLIPRLNRPNAALVFIPVESPYTPGTTSTTFEWLQPAFCTAYFQLNVEWRGTTPGYKLLIRDKRTCTFYDWMTFSAEEFERVKQDKKANGRIVECIHDRQWPTFIPCSKGSWDVGNPDYQDDERGPGWRAYGWRFVRFRDDIQLPIEKNTMITLEQSIAQSLRFEDFETAFPDDPIKQAAQAKARKVAAAQERVKRAAEQEQALAEKRRRTAGATSRGIGVCYDFQNKGNCRRGESCHFSHCACDTTCTCTSESNTFGQRPTGRDEISSDKKSSQGSDDDEEAADIIDGDELRELAETSASTLNETSASLVKFDKASIASKLSLLNTATNSRIWAQFDRPRRPIYGYTVAPSGEVQVIPRPSSRGLMD